MREKQEVMDTSVVSVTSSNSIKTKNCSGSRGGFCPGARVPDTPGSGAKATEETFFLHLRQETIVRSEGEFRGAGTGLGAQGTEPAPP